MTEHLVTQLDAALLRRLVEAALEEDGARLDITTRALVPPDVHGRAAVVAKDAGVVAGLSVAAAVFAALDVAISFEGRVSDGARVMPGDILAHLDGPLAPVLSGERVALNFLQHLSGIASVTRALVDSVAGLDVRIFDTRKTTPGLRVLERYAVRVGGGHNHRFNLTDAVLVKDNHLAVARERELTIGQVVERTRQAAPRAMRVEIEVTTVAEAREAADAGADAVLLDNMPIAEMREAVQAVRGRALIEASGGVTLATVRAIAETGVDIISVGGITHSAPALDMSLEVTS